MLTASHVTIRTIELDTTEIIMNNEVKPPEESDFPRMHLAVVEGDNHIESPYHYSSDELTIAFVNPYTKKEFQDDLQFVIEVDGPAEFVGGGAVGCENRRVSARMYDASHDVQLKINDKTAKLRLWAGWATGQESVRLTENLMLEPHTTTEESVEALRALKDGAMEEGNSEPGNPVLTGDEASDTASDGLENSEPENSVLNDEESNGEETNGDIPNDPSSKLEKIEQIKEQIKKFQDLPNGSPLDSDGSDFKKDAELGSEKEKRVHLGDVKEIIRKTRSHPAHHAIHHVHEIGKKIHDAYLYDEEKQQSFRQQYDSDEFAGRLDTQRHILGSLFFLGAIGYIIFMNGRRRGTKGRREL